MDTIIVQLEIFKGAQIVRGEDGKIQNQNQKVKLKYDSKEWYGFIGKMYKNGWGRVNVLAAKIDKGATEKWSDYDDVKDELLQNIDAEVQAKLKKSSDKPLTQEQKEIKALKDEMAEMKAALTGVPKAGKVVIEKKPIDTVNEELEAAREEYEKLFGKAPHHMAQLKSINKSIAEEKGE